MAKSNHEQFADPVQSQLVAQQERWVTFANRNLESATKLFQLQWTTTREMFDESTIAAQKLLTVKNPQELLTVFPEVMRTNFDRMLNYAGEFTSIATNVQADLSKATQIQLSAATGNVSGLPENSGNKTLSISPNPFELMKIAMENAKSGYEQWVVTGKKVAESIEGNMALMSIGRAETVKKSPLPPAK